MYTQTHEKEVSSVHVSANDMFTRAFAQAGERFHASVAYALAREGHRMVWLLAAQHAAGPYFWLVAPQGEGEFLAMMAVDAAGDAIIDHDDPKWVERQRWTIHARQPMHLVTGPSPALLRHLQACGVEVFGLEGAA